MKHIICALGLIATFVLMGICLMALVLSGAALLSGEFVFSIVSFIVGVLSLASVGWIMEKLG